MCHTALPQVARRAESTSIVTGSAVVGRGLQIETESCALPWAGVEPGVARSRRARALPGAGIETRIARSRCLWMGRHGDWGSRCGPGRARVQDAPAAGHGHRLECNGRDDSSQILLVHELSLLLNACIGIHLDAALAGVHEIRAAIAVDIGYEHFRDLA
jgi:hypothetical protein